MTAPTPTSGDSGYSRFMRLDFLVAAGDSCISPRESEQYTALGWHSGGWLLRELLMPRKSRVAVAAGSCRAALGLDGRGALPHTSGATIATMSLQEYKRKRRFEETPEPPPKVEKQSRHRFVVQ